jgi:hypothetical protein
LVVPYQSHHHGPRKYYEDAIEYPARPRALNAPELIDTIERPIAPGELISLDTQVDLARENDEAHRAEY